MALATETVQQISARPALRYSASRPPAPPGNVEGFIVENVTRCVDQAVLAVAGVGIERHIGDHAEIRKARLERLHNPRHQAIGIEGLGGIEGFLAILDHREERQRRHAKRHRLLGDAQQIVEGDATDAGHRRHGLDDLLALEHEHRIDQVVRRQAMLAHQTAGKIIATHATHAGRGKGRLDLLHGGLTVLTSGNEL